MTNGMNPKAIYIFNMVAVAAIAGLWLADVIGLLMLIGLIITEASVSIWLAVLFMRRERDQLDAFQDLFAAMAEHRNVGHSATTPEEAS